MKGEKMKCIENFGGETYFKAATTKTVKRMEK
jgi:hypothetical protein